MARCFGLLLVGCGLLGLWNAAAGAACGTTCICKDCFQISNLGNVKNYRVVDSTPTCCREWRHDVGYDTHCSTMGLKKMQQVDAATPYCNDWDGATHRTAQFCGHMLEGNPVDMSCCGSCLPNT